MESPATRTPVCRVRNVFYAPSSIVEILCLHLPLHLHLCHLTPCLTCSMRRSWLRGCPGGSGTTHLREPALSTAEARARMRPHVADPALP